MYNLPRLKQEETKNMNRPITSTEIETIIKNLPRNKSPGPNSLMGEFNQKFRDQLTPLLCHPEKLFQKVEEEEKLQDSFYKATTYPNTKTRQR